MNPPSYLFYRIRQVQMLVASHSDELRAGRTNNQYLVFRKVTNAQLTDMDKQRAKIGKHIRMEYHTDTGDLIIKLMPSEKHESAHITLADEIQEKEIVQPAQTRLLIEKWCLSPAANLRVTTANPNPNALVSTKMQEVSIIRNPDNIAQPGTYTVNGGDLVLEFQSLYLRAPVVPGGDLIFTTAILSVWARYFWEA